MNVLRSAFIICIVVSMLTACGSASTMSTIAGRIAGSITISGAVPITDVIAEADDQSNVDLAVYPSGSIGFASIQAIYDLPELGQLLLNSGGPLACQFQFDGLPEGSYQLGLFSTSTTGSNETVYTSYWVSDTVVLSEASPGIKGLKYDCNCYSGQPTGTVTGRVPLCGQMIEGKRFLRLLSYEKPTYMWPVDIDEWNRMVIPEVDLPVENYRMHIVGVNSDFWETYDAGPMVLLPVYFINVEEDNETEVGYVPNFVSFLDTPILFGMAVMGEVTFEAPPETSRDVVIEIERNEPSGSNYDREVFFLDHRSIEPDTEYTYFFEFVDVGLHKISVLSISDDPNDVLELAVLDSPHEVVTNEQIRVSYVPLLSVGNQRHLHILEHSKLNHMVYSSDTPLLRLRIWIQH